MAQPNFQIIATALRDLSVEVSRLPNLPVFNENNAVLAQFREMKADHQVFQKALLKEFEKLRTDLSTELRTEMQQIRNGMQKLRTDISTELRTEMQQIGNDMQELRTDLSTELRTEIQQTRNDMQQLRTELSIDMQHMSTAVQELRVEVKELRTDTATDFVRVEARKSTPLSESSAGASGGSAPTFYDEWRKNQKFIPTSSKPAGWSGAWYNPDPRPEAVMDENERDIFDCQGRCWTCRGSGHGNRDECCPEFGKQKV